MTRPPGKSYISRMDTSFLWLAEASVAMFLGSMMAGLIPLKLSVDKTKMRWCTIFGAGLLIGTAFTVIIPEGIETLYNAKVTGMTRHNETSHREKRHAHGGGHSCDEARTPYINSKLGFSLIFGFLFMLLVDQLSSRPRGERSARGRIGVSATIGLVVHAAVDGVAMGTSSFSDQQSLKWIIFFAIMLHKMPAAFGLVTFLQSSRMSKKRTCRHLTVFSLAAPVAALLTFWMMNWVAWLSSQVAIGCLMLFSAGTFMYVATIHVFPELSRARDDGGGDEEDPMTESLIVVDLQRSTIRAGGGGHSHSTGPSLSGQDALFMIGGAVLPGLSMLVIH